MSLMLSKSVLKHTTHPIFEYYRSKDFQARSAKEVQIAAAELTEEVVEDLRAAADKAGDKSVLRAVKAIIKARAGDTNVAIPSFTLAATELFTAYLKQDLIDGYIYVTGDDGKLYPELVTAISFDSGELTARHSKERPSVQITTLHYGYKVDSQFRVDFGSQRSTHTFFPEDATRRKVSDALLAKGIFKETPELRAAYLASLERHNSLVRNQFGKQFRFSGRVFESSDRLENKRTAYLNRKVIHDLSPDVYSILAGHHDSALFDANTGGQGLVPEHPIVKVFDLGTDAAWWVHSDLLEPYKYDKSLRDKLVLPATHFDLLDILTSDLDDLVDDLIEGKAAGNIVLCKGPWGVGKTLTAEIYAELMEKPLFKVHAGLLGVDPEQIEERLKHVLSRAQAWGALVLLDEADVFVQKRRAGDLIANAVTAAFLRVLEYNTGMIFLTTNRGDDLDEAMVQRCLAIIDFVAPDGDLSRRTWKVMADNFDTTLSDDLIEKLVRLFPGAAPRDIKLLLRLVLKWQRRTKEDLGLDLFRRAAVFRAIKMHDED